jgi:hypothetical protein
MPHLAYAFTTKSPNAGLKLKVFEVLMAASYIYDPLVAII